MKRPKCLTCEGSTKTAYQRTGKSAKFVSINRWWYCETCNQMYLGAEIPSENEEDYSHPDAALVYPKISPFVKESFDKTGYLYINELKEGGIKDPELRELTSQISRFFQPAPEPKEVLVARWICEQCETSLPVDEDEEEPRLCNCGSTMKISIEPKSKNTERSELLNEISELLETQPVEDAFIPMTRLMLWDLAQPFQLAYRPDFRGYLSLVQQYPDLKGTWIHHTYKSLIFAFQMDLSMLKDLNAIQSIDFKITNQTIERLRIVFSDIMGYLFLKDPVMVPQLRQQCFAVEKQLLKQLEQTKILRRWIEKKEEVEQAT